MDVSAVSSTGWRSWRSVSDRDAEARRAAVRDASVAVRTCSDDWAAGGININAADPGDANATQAPESRPFA
jgi:hypothetical protein